MGEQFSDDLRRLACHLLRIQTQIEDGDIDGGLEQMNDLRDSMERYAAYLGQKPASENAWGFSLTIGDLSVWQQAVDSLDFGEWDNRDTRA